MEQTVQSTILYHFFRVTLFFHLLQLNSVLVLLLQLLHRLPHLSLLIASSARLLFIPTLRHHIVEAREDDECQHDPQEHVMLEQPRHISQVLDLHAEDPCR